jgi:hypothetical protein
VVEVRVEAKKFPRTEYRSPRMKRRNHITTQKGEESHKQRNMSIGTLFLEEEEEEEAEGVK